MSHVCYYIRIHGRKLLRLCGKLLFCRKIFEVTCNEPKDMASNKDC